MDVQVVEHESELAAAEQKGHFGLDLVKATNLAVADLKL